MNPVFFGKQYCILWMDWYVDQKVHSQGTTGTEESVILEGAIEGCLEEDG
ncbi:MAG: hypothetical protein JSW35_03505 [Deltaproteobacteria bacterium]|nr:MAG: hypothetical protein JSW35_03505 [Deltaproteobacteria bacterium]